MIHWLKFYWPEMLLIIAIVLVSLLLALVVTAAPLLSPRQQTAAATVIVSKPLPSYNWQLMYSYDLKTWQGANISYISTNAAMKTPEDAFTTNAQWYPFNIGRQCFFRLKRLQ